MWTARLLFAAHLLVCRLATDAPPADAPSSWSPPTDYPTFRPSGPASPAPPAAPAPPAVMLRLGNSTIDSSKSFKVPQAPTQPAPSTMMPPLRSPTPQIGSPEPIPHVVAVGGPHTHHHHDRRFGPTFDDVPDGNLTRVTVQLGDDASLNCRISLLQDKTVSWVRRRGTGVPELLTVGAHTYAADSRVSVARRYPGNWKLDINSVRTHDEGIYECQISTHPPRVSRTYLHVNTPQVWVVDEAGAPLLEKYYEAESTLALVCRARDVDVPAVLSWLHEGKALNADTTRGGISVRTEQVSGGADSTLRLARVNASDAGNYTCAVRGARSHTVAVHVLNEESLAELHAGASNVFAAAPITVTIVFAMPLLGEHARTPSSATALLLAIATVLAATLAPSTFAFALAANSSAKVLQT